uniref:Aldehyde dehydrogenase domain-containing protein n=1 Tax=Zea mays TaxID=4577 RepID=A0A804PKX8_MAIZE
MGSVPEEKAKLGFGGLVGDLREVYESGRTQGLEWRQSQLRGLVRLLEEKEEEIFDVLHEDLGKHRGEAFRDEVGVLKKSVVDKLQNLKNWAAPEKAHTPLVAFPATALVVPEPLGVVLVFSCWNLPIGLALEPLSGALAAGNAVVVKPSELAPATSAFLAANIPKYLDSKAVKVVEGGPEVGEKLMEHRWDKVLFTGSCESHHRSEMVHLFRPSLHRHRLPAGGGGVCSDSDRDAQVDAGEVLHQARVHGAHPEREAVPEAERLPGRPQGGVFRGPRRPLQPQDAEHGAHASAQPSARLRHHDGGDIRPAAPDHHGEEDRRQHQVPQVQAQAAGDLRLHQEREAEATHHRRDVVGEHHVQRRHRAVWPGQHPVRWRGAQRVRPVPRQVLV